MSFSPRINALVVVFLLTALMLGFWFKYSSFLEQGRKPPVEAIILNQLEKEGLPTFKIKSLDGRDIEASNFNGKLLIVNFWASWCDPCVAEFPSLIKLIKRYNGQIILLGISADYEEADIRNFLKAFSAQDTNLIIAWDKDQEIAKKFGTFKLPESYIIGRNGRLIRKISGVDDWASKDAISFFDELLLKK